MKFSPEKLLINVRQATTEDLLDRCTLFREGMEPEALEIIEAELRGRGVSGQEIAHHAENYPPILKIDGLPVKCSFCSRPAVEEAWDWHRLWGLIPIFPRLMRRCADHAFKP